jgi:hypothetical protein
MFYLFVVLCSVAALHASGLRIFVKGDASRVNVVEELDEFVLVDSDEEDEGYANAQVKLASINRATTNWAFDRIDQPHGMDGFYRSKFTGRGVDVYVVDSGISHSRVRRTIGGVSFVADDLDPFLDCNGHGTHLASLISGIAPQSAIYSIKVFNCTGKASFWNVLSGLQWIKKHISNKKRSRTSVVLLAFEAESSVILNHAVQQLSKVDALVVAAAGNDGRDACDFSPANESSVLTVGSTAEKSDLVSLSSNFGPCIDLYAPGEDVPGSSVDTPDKIMKSGTSVSAAIVAGVVATYRDANPRWSAVRIRQRMKTSTIYKGISMPRVLAPIRFFPVTVTALTDMRTVWDPMATFVHSVRVISVESKHRFEADILITSNIATKQDFLHIYSISNTTVIVNSSLYLFPIENLGKLLFIERVQDSLSISLDGGVTAYTMSYPWNNGSTLYCGVTVGKVQFV